MHVWLLRLGCQSKTISSSFCKNGFHLAFHTMRLLEHLFRNNRIWAEAIHRSNPAFFQNLCNQQSPKYLWIGCSDSRVPANQIVGLLPGEMFVHRNIANVVCHTDLNCLSAIQFAVDLLKIQHIIVCGHYGCAGVSATLREARVGLSDNWLRHVQDVRQKHKHALAHLTETEAADHLCQLNVIEQVINVCQTTITRDAWDRGQSLAIHGWIYRLEDGLLQDLNITIAAAGEIATSYDAAIASVARNHQSVRRDSPL